MKMMMMIMIVINKNRKRFLNDAFFLKKKKIKIFFKNDNWEYYPLDEKLV